MKTRTPFVARSTFASEKAKSTSRSEHFWKLRCRKSARRCGAKHMSKSKCTKHTIVGPLLEVETSKKCTPLWREAHFEVKMYKTFGPLLEVVMSKKCTPLWREAHFEVKSAKNWGVRSTFGRSDAVLRGRRDCAPCQKIKKWAKREGFVAFPETMASVGHLKKICKDAFSVAGTVQETCSSKRWFPETGCILEHQIFRFAEMILRDSCSTSYDPASPSRGRRSTLDGGVEKSQNALVRGRQLCTQLSIFEGSLAELLRFCCCHCQLRKLRKSGRIVSFLMLPSSKIEEVSHKCCVFKLADRHINRQLQLQLQLQLHYFYNYKYSYMYKILHYVTLHWFHYTTLITLHYANCSPLH